MKRKFIIAGYALAFGVLLLSMISGKLKAQAIIYQENFGIPNGNTLVQNYTGWQDTTVKYVSNGTCDVRKTNASSGYNGASGGGNVMINDTSKWFQVSGIVSGVPNEVLNLYIGLRKTAGENGSNFKVQCSVDSVTWQTLTMEDTLPSGTGTSGWYRVKYPDVPCSQNLHLRFSCLANVEYRLDDICVRVGDEAVMETVATPSFSMQGGTYYEPQQLSMSTATPGASMRYTLDGSLPGITSDLYEQPIEITNTCTVKAIAMKEGMLSSNVATLNLTIVDTNALVVLPFDISDNSYTEKAEIKNMNGFTSWKLGVSYSDGGAKFESKFAGEAYLLARLDGMPDSLFFDMQGHKTGNPSVYSGVSFLVSESADGENWSDVARIDGSSISTNRYSHFGGYALDYRTRFVRWLLLTAEIGNTQLNNIRISRRDSVPSDDVGVAGCSALVGLEVVPNPVSSRFAIVGNFEVERVVLYDMRGVPLKTWTGNCCKSVFDISGLRPGSYVLVASDRYGASVKRLMVKV